MISSVTENIFTQKNQRRKNIFLNNQAFFVDKNFKDSISIDLQLKKIYKNQRLDKQFSKQNSQSNDKNGEQKSEIRKKRTICQSLIYVQNMSQSSLQIRKNSNSLENQTKLKNLTRKVRIHEILPTKQLSQKVKPSTNKFSKVIDISTTTIDSLNYSLNLSRVYDQNVNIPKRPQILQRKKSKIIKNNFYNVSQNKDLIYHEKDLKILKNSLNILQKEEKYLKAEKQYQIKYFTDKKRQFQFQQTSWKQIVKVRQQQIRQLKEIINMKKLNHKENL